MKALFARFIQDDQGQDLIEYALLGTFVALAVAAGAQALAGGLNTWYEGMGTTVGGIDTSIPPPSGD